MKKYTLLLVGILVSIMGVAAEMTKFQLKEAGIFAADAKAKFNLSDADTEKVRNIRLEGMKAFTEGPLKLRNDGKTDEAQKLTKKINVEYMEKFQTITGCKPKEYWDLLNGARDKANAQKK